MLKVITCLSVFIITISKLNAQVAITPTFFMGSEFAQNKTLKENGLGYYPLEFQNCKATTLSLNLEKTIKRKIVYGFGISNKRFTKAFNLKVAEPFDELRRSLAPDAFKRFQLYYVLKSNYTFNYWCINSYISKRFSTHIIDLGISWSPFYTISNNSSNLDRQHSIEQASLLNDDRTSQNFIEKGSLNGNYFRDAMFFNLKYSKNIKNNMKVIACLESNLLSTHIYHITSVAGYILMENYNDPNTVYKFNDLEFKSRFYLFSAGLSYNVNIKRRK